MVVVSSKERDNHIILHCGVIQNITMYIFTTIKISNLLHILLLKYAGVSKIVWAGAAIYTVVVVA
jgi:hypothetical protein